MASTYIYRTNGTPTLNTKCTVSFWWKNCEGQPSSGSDRIIFGTETTAYSYIYLRNTGELGLYQASTGTFDFRTSRLMGDCGAWYHICYAFDSTLADSTERIKIYVNGVRETAFNASTAMAQDSAIRFNEASKVIDIGGGFGGYEYLDGLLSHFHFIDGTAYDASTFGETDSTSGIWKIKTSPSVTYGNNGFFLKMEDSSNLDLDSSPNAHTFTTSGNLTATKDNPSNNFCTMNRLWYGLQSFTMENGNTRITPSSNYGFPGNMAMNKGKWYFEAIPKAASAGIGIVSGSAFQQGYLSDGTYAGGFGSFEGNKAYGYVSTATTQYLLEATTTTESWGANLNHTTDVLQIALDLDNNFLYF